jgi:hypothetical protein
MRSTRARANDGNRDEITARYFIGGAKIGDKIRLGFGVQATIRDQYHKLNVIYLELVIEDLIIEIRSDDTEETCSLVEFDGRFFNIRGDGSLLQDGDTYLQYVLGVTDPETSPCRMHCVQRDPGMRLD